MKLLTTSTLALSALLSAVPAMAQSAAPTPEFTLAYNAGIVTDYRFRSIAQSSLDPALQIGADFTHKSGFYAGVWSSNVSWIKDYAGASKGSLELDLYAGYRGEITSGVAYDVGAIRYQYPGNNAATNANTSEIYGAITYGPVTAKYSRSVSNFVANPSSSGSAYLEVAATFDLGGGFSLVPHVGYQSIPNVVGDAGNYTDYSVALSKDFGGGLSATVTAIGTNAKKAFYTDTKGNFLGKDGVVFGVKYSF
jgi:uncharacterized protein (TIGR02001 family)